MRNNQLNSLFDSNDTLISALVTRTINWEFDNNWDALLDLARQLDIISMSIQQRHARRNSFLHRIDRHNDTDERSE